MKRTKRVASVDLTADCFAYVGNTEDTASWMFPLRVPGNDALSINLIRSHLQRFDVQTRDFPDALRQELWATLRGAAT